MQSHTELDQTSLSFFTSRTSQIMDTRFTFISPTNRLLNEPSPSITCSIEICFYLYNFLSLLLVWSIRVISFWLFYFLFIRKPLGTPDSSLYAVSIGLFLELNNGDLDTFDPGTLDSSLYAVSIGLFLELNNGYLDTIVLDVNFIGLFLELNNGDFDK